jgi:PAS domain S-box-containing protein
MPSSAGGRSESEFERELREVNEALLISSVRQHEIIEEAHRAEAAWRKSEAELRLEAEDLDRINRAAVGRESRIIDLKKEINELAQRLGESPRYPLGFADPVEPGIAPGALLTADADALPAPGDEIAPLEAVLGPDELVHRPSRAPDYRTETGTFLSLMTALADSPAEALQQLTQKILESLAADSAGVSVLSPDGKRFHWSAVAGTWQARTGGGTPRGFSPCGDVIDRHTPLLFLHIERRYPYFRSVTPLANEALFAPFQIEGKEVGAIWALRHDERPFDGEDMRELQDFARIASAAYRATQARALALSRRMAALNLMEDALQARQTTEKAYLSLRASEERYRSLFNSIDEGFCVVEVLFDDDLSPVDFRFLETNPAFEKQSGVRDAVGKCVRTLVPQLEAYWFETYGRVALTGESVRFVDEAQALDGRWFDVYAFRLGAPELRRVAILFTDITARRRLEEKTQEQANSLAELNRRKDEFLAMLSHELRNPLAAIRNAAHLIQMERTKGPMQLEAQGMLDRQIAQLTRLVDDLLDVSRISTGLVRLQLESVDLRGIVGRAVEICRPQVDRKEQTLTLSLPGTALWVHGDDVRLEQVIVNLLNNANKYTDRGGLLAVALRTEGDEAVLCVRDNGIGIEPEALPRMFDLFTQANQSLSRAQGGLGIGLALVKSLVAMHGGRIEAHSVPGQGSEFIVILPCAPSPRERPVAAGEIVRAPARALRVLVVEDNPDVARGIARMLGVAGHDARVARDGASGMSMAREFAPDAVLLDIGLPVVDGLQVARWIRQEPGLKSVLLIALTGYGQDSDKQCTRDAGFDYHLVKPVDFKTIESILATVDRHPADRTSS